MELIATCAFGFEKVLYRELKQLGIWVNKTENGKITFEGSEDLICKSNLWLRTADRILIKVSEFEAKNFDELFEKTKAIDWTNYIGKEDAFPIKADSTQSILHSEPAIQSIIKKAIVEKLKEKYRIEQFAENKAVYPIIVKFNKNICTININTSGEGLHKRGYRLQANLAPLKETLAAALVMLSDWNFSEPLIDPFCGSGTIPIEAALIAKNQAPGLLRKFISMDWPWINKEHWNKNYQEAREKINNKKKLQVQGYDLDQKAIKIANDNAGRAETTEVKFKQQDFKYLNLNKEKNGCIITNPPYGERLGTSEEVKEIYESISQKFANNNEFSLNFFTAFPDFEKIFGRKADKNRKLYNGKIQCYLYQYFRKTYEN